MRAVSKAIDVITKMDENSLEEVQKFTEAATREELINEITRYMQSGTYSGKMGDLLPYIGASFLGQPLLTVVLTKDGPYCTYADPSFDTWLKVSKFQNEFLKSLFLPKCQPKNCKDFCPVVRHSIEQKSSLQLFIYILGETITS